MCVCIYIWYIRIVYYSIDIDYTRYQYDSSNSGVYPNVYIVFESVAVSPRVGHRS